MLLVAVCAQEAFFVKGGKEDFQRKGADFG